MRAAFANNLKSTEHEADALAVLKTQRANCEVVIARFVCIQDRWYWTTTRLQGYRAVGFVHVATERWANSVIMLPVCNELSITSAASPSRPAPAISLKVTKAFTNLLLRR